MLPLGVVLLFALFFGRLVSRGGAGRRVVVVWTAGTSAISSVNKHCHSGILADSPWHLTAQANAGTLLSRLLHETSIRHVAQKRARYICYKTRTCGPWESEKSLRCLPPSQKAGWDIRNKQKDVASISDIHLSHAGDWSKFGKRGSLKFGRQVIDWSCEGLLF